LQVFELEEELAPVRRTRPFQQGSADGDAVEERLGRANVVESDHRV